MAKQLTAEHKALCDKLGWDISKIDWGKVVQMIQLLIAILSAASGPSPVYKAKAGCEDQCATCLESAGHSLQATQLSLECCEGMCDTP